MSGQPFRVAGIDHVEIFVPEQYEAARWYREVLGLEILPAFEHWAAGGPLMISSDGGTTMLALFNGEPLGGRQPAGLRRVAFRVDGATFAAFSARLAAVPVYDDGGKRVTAADVVDHQGSFSFYFNDPYGTPLEVTTYDCDTVKNLLGLPAGL
ncbi:MAG TPA: VOC family protein [Chloroflexota bacterium]|nr:VOC family protein [Chloroflexota bacterium]